MKLFIIYIQHVVFQVNSFNMYLNRPTILQTFHTWPFALFAQNEARFIYSKITGYSK